MKEKKIYFPTLFSYIKSCFSRNEQFYIWKCISCMRKSERFNRVPILGQYYHMRKNILSAKTGIKICEFSIDEGLFIYHLGDILINKNAKIGKNLKLHGNVCIGNKGGMQDYSPIIGNNVDIGYGACLLGKIRIGNNVTIGANSVVITDIPDNAVVAGAPAKIIKIKNEK